MRRLARQNRLVGVSTLEPLRRLCLAMPEATERLSHGEPTFFVGGKKVFVMYADHHHDERVGLWCAAPMGFQAALVEADPGRFFVPPYVGHRGWIGVWLDVAVDWDEIAAIVDGAYRSIAPKRLVEELDRLRLRSIPAPVASRARSPARSATPGGPGAR